MSQSLNREGKSVSAAATDAAEPIESVDSGQPPSTDPAEEQAKQYHGAAASPTEAEDPGGTPALNLEGDDDGKEDPAEEPQGASESPAGTTAEAAGQSPSAVPADESAGFGDVDPAVAEPVVVEPVATPATVRALDEGATPAEALSPYDLAGADAAADTSGTAEPGGRTAWSPDADTMPPSIAPRSPATEQSPSAPQQGAAGAAASAAVDEETAGASTEPTGVYHEPVAAAAFPDALSEPVAAGTAQAGRADTRTDKAAGGPTAAQATSRRRRLIPAACAAGAAALLLAWGGIAWWTTQHIAPGTTVSGVDVSGLSPKKAHERIGKGVGDQLAQPVTLTVGQGSSELVPAKSGISVDTDASVKKLTGFTLNPLTLAQRLGGQHTDAVIRVDSTALRGALEDRVDTMANGAVSATVTLDGTKPVTTPASNGIGLDVEASLKQIGGTWPLGKKTLAMAEGTATPAITDEEASTFVDGTLTPLLSSGLTVNTMLKLSSEGGTLSATFDPTALRDAIVARVGQVETPAQNATWKIDGSATGAPGARPQYVPAAQGKTIDTAALSASLLKAGTSATDVDGRTVTLPMVVSEPTVKTPQNEWGISEAIGEFATPYNAGDAPRTQNLTRGAELVNGTVVKPGEVFSLEKTLGEVDGEHGFAAAGVIQNGEHVDAMGGGLSQVATTVFNAGFEAGMDDTEHHPHQYYFERYPAGREATLWTGNLDMKFTNSTPHAVLVQAWLDGEQIHVRMWSTKYYDVSITSSERSNFRPVRTEHGSGPNCEPTSGGQPGFDITVTRTRKHDGKALPDDVLTTKYDGDVDVICN